MGVPEPWEVGVWVQVEKLGLSPRELPKGLEVGASCRAGAGVGRAEAGVVPGPPQLLPCPHEGGLLRASEDSFVASLRVLSTESWAWCRVWKGWSRAVSLPLGPEDLPLLKPCPPPFLGLG